MNTNNTDLKEEPRVSNSFEIGDENDQTTLKEESSYKYYEARVSPDSGENYDKNEQNTQSKEESLYEYYETRVSPDSAENYDKNDQNTLTQLKEGELYRYKTGDMVWGKVKSHPWWPGHVYDEAFASSSVRRSKRKGFVLVAFFGDSSYGWFDPYELIPFEPHYAEKKTQINSKTFLKAVEEAVDEAGRRRGLGLACKCRNPFNFRPANVRGYFAVDLGDKEAASMYSGYQIEKARDEFRARDVVEFMKGLAVRPRKDGRGDLGFLKDKAGVLAYRRTVYEEFDETYAQAFGGPTVQQQQPSVESREAFMQSVKAPLSGPMVIAEALGKKKTSSKSGKKDHTNKDKYLFKRRDEAKESNSQEKGQSTSSVKLPFVESSTQLVDGDYVRQKRISLVHPDQPTSTEEFTEMENATIIKSYPSERFSDPTRSGVSVTKKSDKTKSSLNNDEKLEGQDTKPKIEPGKKKVKNLKRHIGDLGADRSIIGPKKKKIKKEPGREMGSDQIYKLDPTEKDGVSGVRVSEKPVKIDLEPLKKEKEEGLEVDSSLPISVSKSEVKLVDILHALQSLALDPFDGTERHSPALIRHAFLNFRSHVFQKSLALSPPHEVEQNKTYDIKYPLGKTSGSIPPSIKNQSSSKPPKPLFKSEYPTKGGRKRGPSDRQDEIAAKRIKKVTEVKSLIADKKNLVERKDSVIARPQKSLRAEPGKKIEAPRRKRELTSLVIKFPPQSNLPSENELKARLARFGPLDHSRTRIFWKSFSCRVVYLYKSDAESAHKYLSENNTLFGSVMRCYMRPLEAPGPSDLESKPRKDDGPVENMGEYRSVHSQSTLQIKSCLKKSTPEAGPTPGVNGGSKVTSRVKFVLGGGESNSGLEQLVSKSDFKDTSFADGGNIGPLSSVITSTNTSTYGVELNNKNFQQKVALQNPLSNFHPHVVSQFPNPTINVQFPQKTLANTHNVSTTKSEIAQAGLSSINTGFVQEMLSLMNRCNDVVMNLKNSLGYMPYHSL